MTWTPPTPAVTPARIAAVMDALRAELAEIEINGQPLGSAVHFDPAQLNAAGGIGVAILPPTFGYSGSGGMDPTAVTTDVWVVVPNDSNVITNLYAMALGVAQCIDANTPHVVLESTPASWISRGGAAMPGYSLSVALDLSEPSDR